MAKRKRSSNAAATPVGNSIEPPMPPPDRSSARRPSRNASRQALSPSALNPNETSQILDGPDALRASPDNEPATVNQQVNGNHKVKSESPLSDAPDVVEPPKKKRQPAAKKPPVSTPKKDDKMEEMLAGSAARKLALKAQKKASGETEEARRDPEADEDDVDADPEEVKEALSRPPPINSDYLPLPWKGRLGYACLCTYLRYSNPPVFQSRTTRIASILEHRHPLKDPSHPEHATKNRPDKDQPASIERGQKYVEQLCLANCKDMIKMLRWNDKYNIKFLRLSSEAFPFASHAEYGYKLAPFASEALAEVGKVVAELGHRVTTHPGQFTQLGSPRKEVVENALRDLEYHDEMLSLLKLPPQQDRDAVMILHMGGMFGDKAATLDRFRENYQKLPQGIKNRLVLENDDMSWHMHDLLPICKELNIPFVLDFHHHNIIFDPEKIREGTKEVMDYYPEILETWRRKNITPKMHYSEGTPAAITKTQRRKHNPRPATLPPCPNDMDLMIEAKDKEQAVFELMRTFKLPGFDTFNDMLPHVRRDDNKPVRLPAKKKGKKGKKTADEELEDDEEPEDTGPVVIPEEEVGMGGPENRVYWPPGMEEWLRPVKKVVAKKAPVAGSRPKSKAELLEAKLAKQEGWGVVPGANGEVKTEVKTEPNSAAGSIAGDVVEDVAPPKKGKGKGKKTPAASAPVKSEPDEVLANGHIETTTIPTKKPAPQRKSTGRAAATKKPAKEPSPVTTDDSDASMAEGSDDEPPTLTLNRRESSRSKPAKVSYKEEDEDED